MKATTPPLTKTAQLMRLAWIETVIIANGANGISRDDVAEAWRISPAQAGEDLAEYRKLTGEDGRVAYNMTERRFVWQGLPRGAKLLDRTAILPLAARILEAPTLA